MYFIDETVDEFQLLTLCFVNTEHLKEAPSFVCTLLQEDEHIDDGKYPENLEKEIPAKPSPLKTIKQPKYKSRVLVPEPWPTLHGVQRFLDSTVKQTFIAQQGECKLPTDENAAKRRIKSNFIWK